MSISQITDHCAAIEIEAYMRQFEQHRKTYKEYQEFLSNRCPGSSEDCYYDERDREWVYEGEEDIKEEQVYKDKLVALPKPLDLSHRDLSGLDLRNIFLANANLTGARLEDVNLSGSTLIGTTFDGVTLKNANLDGANLQDSLFKDVSARDTFLTNTNLTRCRFDNAAFRKCSLNNSDLSRSRVVSTMTIYSCDLSHTRMDSHLIQQIDFVLPTLLPNLTLMVGND